MTRKTYRVNKDGWWLLKELLVGTPEEFNSDSAALRGRKFDPWVHSITVGQLPEDELAIYRGHAQANVIDFVIYSYVTPIAYRITTLDPQTGTNTSRWIIPTEEDNEGTKRAVRYSRTTSKHQNRVYTAISDIKMWPNE